jgi:transcription elongation factor GreA
MLADQIQYLTAGGLHELEDRLDYLRNIRRPEIALRLHLAVEDRNDLVENAAYADAKREQAFVEGEILRLETILSNAKIINDNRSPDIVELGDKVEVQEKGRRQVEAFRIVGAAEADPAEGRISNESPLGRALIGHHVGDRVQVDAPDGTMVFTIKSILV